MDRPEVSDPRSFRFRYVDGGEGVCVYVQCGSDAGGAGGDSMTTGV